MPSKWDDERNWNEFDYRCHLRASNPSRRGWLWFAVALLVTLAGIAAVIARYWPS